MPISLGTKFQLIFQTFLSKKVILGLKKKGKYHIESYIFELV